MLSHLVSLFNWYLCVISEGTDAKVRVLADLTDVLALLVPGTVLLHGSFPKVKRS